MSGCTEKDSQGSIQTKNGRLYGIQIVRAIACLGILVAHSCAYAEMNFDDLEFMSSLNYWGRYGMLYFTEIFFAMSGFFECID